MSSQTTTPEEATPTSKERQQQPTIFLGHGGGPLPLLGHKGHAELLRTWAPGSRIYTLLHDPSIHTVLVVSAHHESDDGGVCVMFDEKPSLLFDYSGFPPESYKYQMANPGAPHVAARASALLSAAGIENTAQRGRGHDHGVFVPLLALEVAKHRPALPVVSLSLRGPAAYGKRQAPATDTDCTTASVSPLTLAHWDMGRALAPLRDEGVLILGSGNTFHGRASAREANKFDIFLRTLASADGGVENLLRWEDHPCAKKCHPRPEHLLPLIVCAGAAQASKAVECMSHDWMGNAATHFVFG